MIFPVPGKRGLLVQSVNRPKMVTEMTFEFKVDGDKLTGMAHMAHWPGDASITEGKVEGDRISFTCVGKLPWRGGAASDYPASGYPKLDFAWKLEGKDAKITLTWDNVMIAGTRGEPRVLEMQGKKISD